MILKKMDVSKLEEIETLKKILKMSINEQQQYLIKNDLKKQQKGIEAEKQISYFIDFNLGESKNYIILHDLRIEIDNKTAQIDHMLISKAMGIVLIEAKNTDAVVTINNDGTMTYKYKNGKEYNQANPLEQSKRHELVLKSFLEKHDIEMAISSKVVFLPEVIITNEKLPSNFYRADTFVTSLRNETLKNPLKFAVLFAKVMTNNVVSFEHLMYIGGILVKEHKPIKIDYEKKYPISKKKEIVEETIIEDKVIKEPKINTKTILEKDENSIEKICRENNIDTSNFKDIKMSNKYMGNEMVSFTCINCNKIQRKSLKVFTSTQVSCKECAIKI
jgi:hypothetical protein